jgi:hypothetical protein
MALAVSKDTTTPEQVLKALNFKVEKEQAFTKDGKRIPGMVVVRQDNRVPLAWVGETYGLVPHSAVIEPMLDVLGKDFELKRTVVERDGRRVSVNILSKEEVSIAKGDNLRLKAEFINSLDRTQSFKLVVGAFRLLCSNGSGIFLDGHVLNIKEAHTKRVSDTINALNFKQALADTVSKFRDTVKLLKPMTEKKVKDDDAKKLIEEYVGRKSVDEIMALWTTGRGNNGDKTAWNLFNGASQYLTDAEGRALLPIASSLRTVKKTTGLLHALQSLN